MRTLVACLIRSIILISERTVLNLPTSAHNHHSTTRYTRGALASLQHVAFAGQVPVVGVGSFGLGLLSAECCLQLMELSRQLLSHHFERSLTHGGQLLLLGRGSDTLARA